jgi:hypothetical protein
MRMIDADRLRAEIAKEPYSDGMAAAFRLIEASPTIDAKPVRHEKWEPYIGPFSAPVFRCSACGSQTAHFNRHPYCFGCGAKMDGDLR